MASFLRQVIEAPATRAAAREFSSAVKGGRKAGFRRRAAAPTAADKAVAAPKEEWTAVTDPQSGLVYYWNEKTNETTALGEPKPGPEGRVGVPMPAQPQQQGGGIASGLGGAVAAGAGVGIGHAVVGGVIGSMFGGE
mmetsp:Transcript_35812/g.43243  ORF Transcript_35812/g.43243 Transcript_35812/m.43243 type:complete len:137 (+) Transcript_35812:165-575(+)|eukprot:CAMPEP_0197852406 /NCGR_PEP_ID=MMETSP1438-20131217/20522_1 /TAXON_ID=1461541 /ORGANISM="Pterosperma sp., Strain CCMP1384" /LENGTH=136 /DNA_ID=CAMNT_0043466457 /DNA_START=164 /DNA_END=574 /DNA_ORIENTATION=-